MIRANALFYPHISFRNPTWLKAAGLLYDRIYRIVPNGEIPDDAPSLQPLLEDATIGAMIDPEPYATEASERFLEKIEDWGAAALSHQQADADDFTRLHSDKVDQRVRRLISELGYKTDGYWAHVPTELASNYMLFLANSIASRNDFELITYDWPPWTATSYFNLDGKIDEMLLPVHGRMIDMADPFALFGVIMADLIPTNIDEIPAAKIIRFREKRKGEIALLRSAVAELHEELQKLDDPVVREDAIRQKMVILEKAMDEYRRSADVIKARGWFGISFMGVTAPAVLAQMFGLPAQGVTIIGGTSLALGGIFNIQNTRAELEKLRKTSPASCLLDMRKAFKQYTRQRGGGDMNFHAYNCMEEYVND